SQRYTLVPPAYSVAKICPCCIHNPIRLPDVRSKTCAAPNGPPSLLVQLPSSGVKGGMPIIAIPGLSVACARDPETTNPPPVPLLVCQFATFPDMKISGADPVGTDPVLPI